MSSFIVNSFQTPNALVDELLGDLSGNALKCYMVIARKTVGWQKESDSISVLQFQEITKIKDERTIRAALAELEKIGLIKSKKVRGKSTTFRLVTDFSGGKPPTKNVGTKNAPPTKNVGAKNVGGVGAKNAGTTPCKKCTPTKNNINTNINTNNNTSETAILSFCQEQGLDTDLAKEFLRYRKSIKAPLTLNAIKTIHSQAKKAGMSLAEALSTVMARGWRGFEADWVVKKTTQKPQNPQVDYQAVAEAYNEVVMATEVDLPMVADPSNLSDERKKQIHEMAKIFHARFKNYSAEAFKQYFRDFAEQAKRRADGFYFGGLNRTGWKADFSYLMRPSTLDKTVEETL